MQQETAEVLSLDVRCDRAAPSVVRDSISRLDESGWILGDAMLVATELVNNAIRHSGCDDTHELQVRITVRGDALLISVRDPGLSGKHLPPAPTTAEIGGGLGLVIVDSLARRWGANRDQGYCVWAELEIPQPA